jgi:hypothetical protein
MNSKGSVKERRFPVFLAVAILITLLSGRQTIEAARAGGRVNERFTSNGSFSAAHSGGTLWLYERDGRVECRDASSDEAAMFSERDESVGLHRINHAEFNSAAARERGLKIVLRATQQLERFPEAKAAFIRSAAIWEEKIHSPITVLLDVDFGPTLFGTAWPPQSIGGSNAQELTQFIYPAVRSQLIANAADDQERDVYNSLPAISIPTDIGPTTAMRIPSANARALGLIDAVADPDGREKNLGKPPGVGFNSNHRFDFDPADGIDTDKADFEAVVVHEIGHVLGFISSVGVREVDGRAAVAPTVWDLYRLRPETADEFSSAQRILSSGGEHRFAAAGLVLPLSTGRNNGTGGDGFQGSHWKNDSLISGWYIGVMEVGIPNGKHQVVTSHDLVALKLMGYRLTSEIALAPEPGECEASLDGDTLKLSGMAASVEGGNIQARVKALDEAGHALAEFDLVEFDSSGLAIASYHLEFAGLNQLRGATRASVTLLDHRGNPGTTVTSSILGGDRKGPGISSVSFDGGSLKIKGKRAGSNPEIEINGVVVAPDSLSVSGKKVRVGGDAATLNLSGGPNRVRIINGGLRSNILVLDL